MYINFSCDKVYIYLSKKIKGSVATKFDSKYSGNQHLYYSFGWGIAGIEACNFKCE